MRFENLDIGDKFIEHTEERDEEIEVFIKVDDLKNGDYTRDDVNAVTITGKQHYFYSFSKVVKVLL